jgi:hypothetical protein
LMQYSHAHLITQLGHCSPLISPKKPFFLVL